MKIDSILLPASNAHLLPGHAGAVLVDSGYNNSPPQCRGATDPFFSAIPTANPVNFFAPVTGLSELVRNDLLITADRAPGACGLGVTVWAKVKISVTVDE